MFALIISLVIMTYFVLSESGEGGRRDSIESIAFHSLRHDWSEEICFS
jgi:hypothetical protein